MMLKHLKSKTLNKALAALTGRNMQQDWLNYMRRFRATLKASESETGLSLTKRDLERHLSVPEKLEQMCPEFQPMKALVGRRANITPSSTVDSVFLRQNYSMEDIKESAQVRLMMDFQKLNFRSTPDGWGYFSVDSSGQVHKFADSQIVHLFSWSPTRERPSADLKYNRISTSWLDERISHHNEVRLQSRPDPLMVILVGVVCYAHQASNALQEE
ncbi:hypothetical protein PC128_g25094 [Phytophthora cactorum]|nr:hypothetical protein PC128_g25094 [Phytophthora cactorum]